MKQETENRKKKFDENDPFPSRLRDLLGVNDDKQKDTSRGAFKKLADDLGISVATISQYASGMIAPNFDNLIKIAKHFHVSTDYLCGLSDQPTDNHDEAAAAEYTGLSPKSIAVLHFCKDSKVFENRKIISFLNRALERDYPDLEVEKQIGDGLMVLWQSIFVHLEDYVTGDGSRICIHLSNGLISSEDIFRYQALEMAKTFLSLLAAENKTPIGARLSGEIKHGYIKEFEENSTTSQEEE